MKQKHGLQMA